MFCKKCGEKATPGSIFCSNCGAKLQEDTMPQEPIPSAAPSQEAPKTAASSPFSAQTPHTQPIAASPVYASPKRDDTTYYDQIIRKNVGYYLAQFREFKFNGKTKMNWASFFLGLYHAAYRGVWREWLRAVMWPLIVSFVSGLITLLTFVTFMDYPGATLLFMFISSGCVIWLIVAGILFSKHFNRIYRTHVEQKIAQKNLTPDPSAGRVAAAIAIIIGVVLLFDLLSTAVTVLSFGGLSSY